MDLLNTINDSASFPDTMEITLAGGEKTTLGDLRALPAFKGFTKYSQERVAREKELEAKLNQTQSEAQRIAAEYQAVQAQLQANHNDPLAAFKQDPTFGPLAAMMEELKSKAEQLERTNQQLQQSMWLNAHTTVLRDIQSKDKEFQDPARVNALLEYSKNNGLSNLETAYKLMTRDRDIENARKDSEVKALEEGARKARAEMAMIPSGSRRIVTPAPDAPKSFDEAEDAALRDPEVLAIFSGQQ